METPVFSRDGESLDRTIVEGDRPGIELQDQLAIGGLHLLELGGSQRIGFPYCVARAHFAMRSPTGILIWG